mmetsp:Transcript_34285/g.85830  ORF Transcript_34285/g.85830 Transcript_34285/m.85830 type:complete len:376 (-) Transcript_34285:33-1160(-)
MAASLEQQDPPSSPGAAHRAGPEEANSQGSADSSAYVFQLWASTGGLAGNQDEICAGDDVFVSLRSDKDTGKAKVLEVIDDPKHRYHGRMKVLYYDGSGHYHVRPTKMTKIHYGGQKKVLIVPETSDFRIMARTQIEADDRVIDIGSSYGVCTNILAQYCRNNVLGIDIALDMVTAARERYPEQEFVQFDALEERQRLVQACAGADKVFLDLGGNRPMESIVALLPVLLSAAGPALVVVKNRELAKYALKHIQNWAGDAASAGVIVRHEEWWRNMELHCEQLRSQRGAKKPSPYQLAEYSGVAPVRFFKYPLHYKHRETAAGVRICRYYNYGVCPDPASCSYDHGHCHHCGEAGHIAKNCLAGIPSPPPPTAAAR